MVMRNFFSDKLSRGTAITFSFTVVNFIVSLAASIIATRYLGAEGVGIIAMGFMVLEFVAIVENLPYMGFVRDYSIDEKPNKLSTLLGLKVMINIATTFCLLLAAGPLSVLLRVPAVVFLYFAFIPAFSIFDTCTIMVFESRRQMALRNTPGTVENVVKLMLYGAFVYSAIGATAAFGLKLEGIILCTVAASFSSTLVGILLIPSLRLRHFSWKKARYYIKFGAKIQPLQLFSRVIFWFAIVSISFYFGFVSMGYYKVAYSTMFYVITFTSVVSLTLYPTLAKAQRERSREEVERNFSLGFYYALAIALPAAIVLFLFPDLVIVTLYGEAFRESAWMIRWLAPVAVLYSVILPCESLFPAINKPMILLQLGIVEVVANVGLNVVLIPYLGIMGAIIAAWATFAVGIAFAYTNYFRLGYSAPKIRHLRKMILDK